MDGNGVGEGDQSPAPGEAQGPGAQEEPVVGAAKVHAPGGPSNQAVPTPHDAADPLGELLKAFFPQPGEPVDVSALSGSNRCTFESSVLKLSQEVFDAGQFESIRPDILDKLIQLFGLKTPSKRSGVVARRKLVLAHLPEGRAW
jgi:hypothetical protein